MEERERERECMYVYVRERESESESEKERKSIQKYFRELKKVEKERTLNGSVMDGLKRKRTKHKSKKTRTLCLGGRGRSHVFYFFVSRQTLDAYSESKK